MKTNAFNKLNGKGLKIAIAQARFNSDITDALARGAVKALKEAGVRDDDIKIFQAPGSFEIPLLCQKLAKTKKYNGIIAIGAVIKGETAHFDYIAEAAADGIMRVMLDCNMPIAFGVITTYNMKQAQARAGNNKSNKGYEAGMALVEVINNLCNLQLK
ncbi:6,7-dimethyl-8-ribityllumazine synthase [Candidatus Parcubacteria bacterium]|nr:6,7-dimethyl-8-ribityllumazine synthase [Patescibacteria group bacterium]MBU4347085.1 6,7-dimethyl-8-ribityllumazine synthase [Patescibacteria group bacterium]MCG2690740.1 6,7-dimethyl-8-ribityllumazine synthase [Candidatus Parcubacteria bacterium]